MKTSPVCTQSSLISRYVGVIDTASLSPIKLEVSGLLSRGSLIRTPSFLIRLIIEIPRVIHHQLEIAVIIYISPTDRR